MKLHTVFITYNRLDLTRQAIESYLQTVSAPYTFTIVDNGSTDGTEEWLEEMFDYGNLDEVILLRENLYPGFACNRGWEQAPKDANFLHRADNDFIFLPGWCDEVERMFRSYPNIGQLGLRTDEEELHNTHNVGGNCVIRRSLWEIGLRYNETPWPKMKVRGYTEDSYMSPDVRNMGWDWDRVENQCIVAISSEDPNDPYYQETWAARGIS